MPLQRAPLAEFPCVGELFELDCWAVPLAAVRRGSGPSSFGFLRSEVYQYLCRFRKPAGSCVRGSRRVHPVFQQTTAHSFVDPICCVDSRRLIKKATCPAKPITVLDRLRSSRWLEEKFDADPGVETRVHRGAQRRRIRRGRALAARRPCSGGARSMHPSWKPWSDHSSARGESARRSDNSSRGIRELGAPHRGVSSSPLRSFPKLPRSHRVSHRRRRRRQNLRIRTPSCATLSDLQDARVCSKGHLHGLSDPDARPDVHWLPAEASAVIAWHREAAALKVARKQHSELALARAVPARRSTGRPCGKTSQSSYAARTGEQRRKGQWRRGKLRPGS